MGRQANALDWTERDGAGTRWHPVVVPDRPISEIRPRETLADELEVELLDDEEPPTQRFDRPSATIETRDEVEPLSARGVARLSALADWLDGEAPSGAVVQLVRAFLHDLGEVRASLKALTTAAGELPMASGLDATIRSLAHAIGMWRANLVEHVDDLALSEHRSFSGWSSLPEYSSAYTLALVQPALADAESWAIALRGEGATILPLVRAVETSVRHLNATLRVAIEAKPAGSARPLPLATW
ncbi:MAG: hypothetical protein ACLQBL_28730 [Polyangiaceae bacterium]